MVTVTTITNRVLNVASIINIFLISTIGPYTRNATSDAVENVLWNEDAMKASASEHRDKIKASPIITADEENGPCPIASNVDVCTNVWTAAAINAPITKYLPIEKNSSTACVQTSHIFYVTDAYDSLLENAHHVIDDL